VQEAVHESSVFSIHSSCAGFGKLASPANQRLDRFSLLVGQTKRDAILACAEPVILLPGRPFTLTYIHEICTKFNECYTLHRMTNYHQLWVCIRESIGSVYNGAFVGTDAGMPLDWDVSIRGSRNRARG